MFRLMSFALEMPDPKSFATSFFARKEIPGRVYVEAKSYDKAVLVARSISELSETQVRVVPPEWMVKVLTPPPRLFPRYQTWVRIRRVQKKRHEVYLGDIGLVVKQLNSQRFLVCVIPRVVTPGSLSRPPQQLLTTEDMLRIKNHTSDRYISLDLSYESLTWGFHIFPTAEELEMFRECSHVDDTLADVTENVITRNALKPGDRVMVCWGALLGLSGKVIEISEDSVEVYFASLDITESLMHAELRVDIRIGDEVKVIAGDWKDIIGFVVNIAGAYGTIFDPGSQSQVRLYPRHGIQS